MSLVFAPADAKSIPVHLLPADQFDDWLTKQEQTTSVWVETAGFKAASASQLVITDEKGAPSCVLLGLGDANDRARDRFPTAKLAAKLPKGTYHFEADLPDDMLAAFCFGWLQAGYRFDRYKSSDAMKAQLKAPSGVDAARIEHMAAAEQLTRDLVNTPANDMGPAALENAFLELAKEYGATTNVITGDDLLSNNFPLIHTVGRAAVDAPRLLDMRWGKKGPTLTLVGKGVCFDTGGLNLKPGASMGTMKKDMGGAANVMGLARMIMGLNLAVQLRVLIPTVENSVSSNAFRPSDILMSRKGLSVEINNTDAEGRLVLADALAYADEENPDMILSMATLTGAARVAVGPDLAPFYSTDENDAVHLKSAAATAADPVWEMPFWDPYEAMIEPGIADLDNAPAGGMAGSITAALFLRRFVSAPRYMHFDIYSWRAAAKPGLTKGGLAQGPRAILAALPKLLGL